MKTMTRRVRPESGRRYIYFITDGVAIKIGGSRDPFRRYRELQTAHHQQLEILGIMDCRNGDERFTQRQFRDHHIRGEWFKDVPAIREFIGNRCHFHTVPEWEQGVTNPVQLFSHRQKHLFEKVF